MIAEILKRGLATYRRELRSILPVAVLVLVPAAILAGLLRQLLDGWAPQGPAGELIVAAGAVALSGIGYFLLAGMITEIVVSAHHGRSRRSVGATALALPFATLIVVDLIVAGTITVGLELLVLPGLFAAARLGLAPVVIEIEHCGAGASLRRSAELSRGRGYLVLVVLIAILALTALLAIPFKFLAAEFFSATVAEVVGLIAAGIIVKPIGAVIEIELALELLYPRPAG